MRRAAHASGLILIVCGTVLLPMTSHGTPRPTDLDTARAFDRLWATYLPSLQYQFVQALDLAPDLMAELAETSGVRVHMRLWLDRRGQVQSTALIERSSLERFDHACLRAAKALGRLRGLPPQILARGQTHGLEFTFATK